MKKAQKLNERTRFRNIGDFPYFCVCDCIPLPKHAFPPPKKNDLKVH